MHPKRLFEGKMPSQSFGNPLMTTPSGRQVDPGLNLVKAHETVKQMRSPYRHQAQLAQTANLTVGQVSLVQKTTRLILGPLGK